MVGHTYLVFPVPDFRWAVKRPVVMRIMLSEVICKVGERILVTSKTYKHGEATGLINSTKVPEGLWVLQGQTIGTQVSAALNTTPNV